MSMNRETKRMLRKQGQLGEDDQPVRQQRQQRGQPQPKAREERTSPRQFLREVRAELRKVAWPTREEVVNYSVIVFITVVVLTLLIMVLDFVFGEGVLRLLNADS
jgi:preprotein translocase subunit SecE